MESSEHILTFVWASFFPSTEMERSAEVHSLMVCGDLLPVPRDFSSDPRSSRDKRAALSAHKSLFAAQTDYFSHVCACYLPEEGGVRGRWEGQAFAQQEPAEESSCYPCLYSCLPRQGAQASERRNTQCQEMNKHRDQCSVRFCHTLQGKLEDPSF